MCVCGPKGDTAYYQQLSSDTIHTLHNGSTSGVCSPGCTTISLLLNIFVISECLSFTFLWNSLLVSFCCSQGTRFVLSQSSESVCGLAKHWCTVGWAAVPVGRARRALLAQVSHGCVECSQLSPGWSLLRPVPLKVGYWWWLSPELWETTFPRPWPPAGVEG